MMKLVLLPGMDGTGALFAELVASLGDSVETIVVAYPQDQAQSYAALTEFALRQLPVSAPFVLLAESFSGPIAIDLASRTIPGLAGVILCCTFAVYPTAFSRHLKHLVPIVPVSRSAFELGMPMMLGSYSTSPLRTAIRQTLRNVLPSTLRARLRAVLSVDLTARLAEIRTPVLYLQASDDRIVNQTAVKHILLHLPQTKIVSINGPHLLLQARPEQCARVIGNFVEELAT